MRAVIEKETAFDKHEIVLMWFLKETCINGTHKFI